MNFRIRYCHIVVENTWVVWLEGPHRFIQFKEPAFFVFEEWASGQEPQAIANNCTERYGLPQEEAVRFVGEIISETEKLFKAEVKVKIKKETVKPNKAEVEAKIKAEEAELKRIHSEYLCRIGGKTILFRYGDEVMEEAFRPLFEQFEQSKNEKVEVKVEVKVEDEISNNQYPLSDIQSKKEKDEGTNNNRFKAPLKTKDLRLKTSNEDKKSIELFSRKGEWCIGINGEQVQSFPEEDWEHFHGTVYTELLNLLHGKKLQEWMGVFHAAAVVKETKGRRDSGNEGLRDEETKGQGDRETEGMVFVGESGSGKSTVAAILMAHGYRVLTDDFLPVEVPNKVEVKAKVKIKEEIDRSSNQQIDKSLNQQIIKSSNQQIDRSSNQQIDRSSNQQIDKSLNQQIDKSSNQQIDKSSNQQIDKWFEVEVKDKIKVEAEVEDKIYGETSFKTKDLRLKTSKEFSQFEAILKTKDLRLKTSTDPEKVSLLYPLPAAISVKKNAIPILAKWYPALEKEMVDAAEEESYETYLPLTGNAGDLSPIPAKAIFFVQYDPMVDFRLTRESNLEKMNDFLKLSWIPRNRGAAQAFLEWYFSLPVYSLVYSDPEKLVKGVTFLPTT